MVYFRGRWLPHEQHLPLCTLAILKQVAPASATPIMALILFEAISSFREWSRFSECV